MVELSRRGFFAGLLGVGAVLAAPAIIRIPNLIMPIRALRPDLPLFGRSAIEGMYWVEHEGQFVTINSGEFSTWSSRLVKMRGGKEALGKIVSGGQATLDWLAYERPDRPVPSLARMVPAPGDALWRSS